MKETNGLPVLKISNFDDYNNCMKFEKSFYIRKFNEHIKENHFIEKPHGHNFFLILLVTVGSGTHTIDFLEYEVIPGSMFIISPGQIHQWSLSKNIDGYILFFTKEFFLHDFDMDKLTRFPFFNSTFSQPMLQLNVKEKEEILAKYEMIYQEYQNRCFNYQEMIRIYLNTMFIQLSRVYLNDQYKEHKFNYDLIQLNRYEALVDKYYKLHRPISCYSKKMNITDRQLSYLCKKTVGKTPSEIMMNRIILEAKRLIVHSVLSISAISKELNFNDSSYFIRLFKKMTKQTPEQFRNGQYNRY